MHQAKTSGAPTAKSATSGQIGRPCYTGNVTVARIIRKTGPALEEWERIATDKKMNKEAVMLQGLPKKETEERSSQYNEPEEVEY